MCVAFKQGGTKFHITTLRNSKIESKQEGEFSKG